MSSKRLSRDPTERPVVVSCFDYTGTFVRQWADAGYECHIVDMQHPAGKTVDGNVTKWGMDVLEWEKMFFTEHADAAARVVVAAFFPPCTDLAVSGARWFVEKERKNPGTRQRAMDLVLWSDRVGRAFGCPYFIENPVSIISSEWRKPDFRFHPYEFGGYVGGEEDGYTKTTCLWTGGNFSMPSKKPIPQDPRIANKIHMMPPSKNRQNLRSKTPAGFARAVYEHYSMPSHFAKRHRQDL